MAAPSRLANIHLALRPAPAAGGKVVRWGILGTANIANTRTPPGRDRGVPHIATRQLD
jgi:hypothetical protein